jgi:hypothetical protein
MNSFGKLPLLDAGLPSVETVKIHSYHVAIRSYESLFTYERRTEMITNDYPAVLLLFGDRRMFAPS